MLVHALRTRDQSIHQGMPDAAPARRAININGMLDRVPITIPRPESPKRRITQDVCAVRRDQHRIAGLLALLQPGHASFRAGKLFVPYRGRMQDRIIVDPQDARRVGFRSITYLHDLLEYLLPVGTKKALSRLSHRSEAPYNE